MGKIAKQLHYRKNGVVTNINLYNSPGDVGANKITLKVDGVAVYAQLGAAGSPSATDLTVRNSGGTVLKVRSKVEDPTMISSGTVANNVGVVPPTPTGLSGTYQGVGSDASNGGTCNWTSSASWAAVTNAQLTVRFTITIAKAVTLSDVHHFRLKYGTTTACASDGGTTTGTSWTIDLPNATYYFLVHAEDASNNVLYSSSVYGGVASIYSTTAAAGLAYHIDKSASNGTGRVRLYDGGATSVNGWANDANAKRWFYVATTTNSPWAGDNGTRWSGIVCADTCACNCNYCTCNCNYCTCNCNYSPCNCCNCSSSP